MADVAEGDEDALRFIENGLVYKLPWGMEALRVRAAALGDLIMPGTTINDYERRDTPSRRSRPARSTIGSAFNAIGIQLAARSDQGDYRYGSELRKQSGSCRLARLGTGRQLVEHGRLAHRGDGGNLAHICRDVYSSGASEMG
jgi:hypothetical protein